MCNDQWGHSHCATHQMAHQGMIVKKIFIKHSTEHSFCFSWVPISRFCFVLGYFFTKYPKLYSLKQRNFIPLHFWRPEVQNQSVDRDWLSQGSMEGSVPCPSLAFGIARNPWPSLAYSWITPTSPSVVTWLSPVSSQCLSLCVFPSSYKDDNHTGLRAQSPPLWPHFT